MASPESRPAPDARAYDRTPVGLIAALAACSLFALLAVVIPALAGPVPALVSFALAVLPVPVVVAGVLWLDRLEPEPPVLLALVFGAGAGAAALIVLAGHAFGTSVTTPELGPHTELIRTTFGAALAGALVAESAKGAVLLGLLRFNRQELDGTHDGVVYASMVGLGFALIANLHAYLQAKGAAGTLASAFVLRGILTPLWDPLFSSMIGVGVAYAAMRRGASGMWAVGLGWVAAVALHTIWDDSVAAGATKATVVYVVLLGALAALLIAVIIDRRRIVGLINDYLPAYASSGVVTPSDVVMLSSLRGRRLARQWARLHVGSHGMRAMADYQLAATELVLACNKADRKVMERAECDARRETSLTLMRTATALFQRRRAAPPPWADRGGSAFGPARPPSAQPPPGQLPEDSAPPAVS